MDEPDGTGEDESRWVGRTPTLPEQWSGPPLVQGLGALAIVAIGDWLQPSALPVAVTVGAVGLVGAAVLAVVGRRAYWYPSRAATWDLHRTRVVVWSAAAVALAVFALAIGAQAILLGLGIAAFGVSSLRGREPTRFELRGRAAAGAAVAVASAVLALVAVTMPTVDESHSARWLGWGVVIVPLTVVVAVLQWRAAARRTDDALSGRDRSGS